MFLHQPPTDWELIKHPVACTIKLFKAVIVAVSNKLGCLQFPLTFTLLFAENAGAYQNGAPYGTLLLQW